MAGSESLPAMGRCETHKPKKEKQMFVVIYQPENNDRVIYQRRMGPNEKLDLDRFALIGAIECEAELDTANGHIPNCCGDIRVEFRPHRDNGLHIWSGQSYYFKRED
jgi:hypothetical protein